MKHLYSFIGLVLIASLNADAATSTLRAPLRGNVEASAIHHVLSAPAASSGFTLTDLQTQVYGRYSCEYYSPITDPTTGKPFGNCIEQPMIVADYFAEQPGDVNIGYLFILNGILKGHIDMEAGTIEIPSRFVTMYYENPDDLSDPGLEVHFCAVDIVDGKYKPNYDRPFIGTFELHHGKITKITSDDIWAYTALAEDGSHVGWFEIARNSTFYLGYGEMEYITDHDYDGDGKPDTEQTIIHGTSDGSTVKVYNLFRTGWETPIEIAVDATSKTASFANQTVTVDGQTLALVDGKQSQTFSGTIRNVIWDVDYREADGQENTVIEFPAAGFYSDKELATVRDFSNIRIYMKEDVTKASVSGVDNVVTEADATPVYYNIEGMRVAEPTAPGLYIERRGTKVSKRLLR